MNWDNSKTQYFIRSAGPDKQFNTGGDLAEYVYFRRNHVATSAEKTGMVVEIEHGQGAYNGRGEISETVVDLSGAVVANATVKAKNIVTGHSVSTRTDQQGETHPVRKKRQRTSSRAYPCTIHLKSGSDGALFEIAMNYHSKVPDPKQAWHKVLERLYHEDHILYARMNNFSTVQAFLATALAFTTSATTTAHNISLIVSLFGLALSLFYISIGFRGVRVIQFWRAYLRLLESIPGVTSIDSHLFEFYRLGHRSGPEEKELPLAEGLAIKIETAWWARRSVHDQFPWYLPGFSGTMFIAVGIPTLTTSFWVLVLYALFHPHAEMRWFVLGLAGGLMLVFLAHLFAGRLIPAPIYEGQVHREPVDPEWDRDVQG